MIQRTKLSLIIICLILISSTANAAKSNLSLTLNWQINQEVVKTLIETKRGSQQGYTDALAKRPVLEILYAWQGYDQWEAVGVNTSRDKYGNAAYETGTYQPVAAIPNNEPMDVTALVGSALNKGGLYIARKQFPILTCQSDSDNPYVADAKGNFPERSWANGKTNKWTGVKSNADSEMQIAMQAANNLAFCMGPQAMVNSYTRSGNYRYIEPEAEDLLKNMPYAKQNADAQLPPDTISGITVLKNHAAFSNTDKTLGIVYRDATGVHFRRFEGWQNASLPMINSFKILDQNSTSGQLYYSHQFEELGRGLITFTTKGANGLSIIATDRFGWQNTAYKNRFLYPGVLNPIHGFGPDMKMMHPAQKNLPWDYNRNWYAANELSSSDQATSFDPFNFCWSTTGSYINLKPGGYGIIWYDGQLPLFSTTALQYYNLGKPYRYYDANNVLQSLAIGSNVDPTINENGTNKLIYPGSLGAESNVWFAFDHTPNGMNFMVGSGAPTSENDWNTSATNPSARLLYQSTLTVSPYLRNFGFRSLNNLGDGFTANVDSTLFISNVESRPLNPGAKFCTPPFCKQKFLFWRKEWVLPASDYFSLKFKASGDSVNVAFGDKTYAQRTTDPTMDTGYIYAININNGGISIEKNSYIANKIAQSKLTLNTDIKPSRFLAGDDKSAFYSYWITYANGTFEVGHGDTPGQNVIAQATDPAPINCVSYCFSSNIRPTDYINITAASYQTMIDTSASSAETLGTYTDWASSRTFTTPGRGALLFSYKGVDDTSAPLMLGLSATLPPAPKAGQKPTAITPDYQIIWGTQSNTASEVKQKSTTVFTQLAGANADGTQLKLLANDGQWHDLWMAYNDGTIAYGSGTQIGANLLGSWKDANPVANIRAFSFTSPANSLQIRINSIPTFDDQTKYTALADAPPATKPLWQTLTPNRGAINLTATRGKSDGIIDIGLKSSTQGANDTPLYNIVINDAGTAYIKKNSTKQADSITPISTAQMPSDTGTTYWVAWRDGVFLVGTGTNPLDLSSLFIQWQDTDFATKPTPPISIFTLAALKQTMSYTNISFVPFAQYENAFTNSATTLQDRAAIQTAWLATPTQLDLKPSVAQTLYWHQSLTFDKPGQTAITFSAQKKSTTPLQLFIGLSDTMPASGTITQLSGAKYYLTISDDGSITATTGAGTAVTTLSGNHALFKKLADGMPHTIWLNIAPTAPNLSAITIGIDSKPGVNPLISGTLPTGTTILNNFGLGANASTVSYSQIADAPFNDPTKCTTPDTGVFTWQDTWAFSASDQEKINFTITALNPTTQTLSLLIGLGLDTAKTPPNAAQFNGAEYVISIDYTGQIALFKKPNYGTKLGSVRYADQGDTARQALVKTLASGSPCRCTVAYDAGRMQLIIGDSTVIWDYTDETPIKNINRFSFSSIKSSAQISNISTLGGQLLRSLEQLFNLLPSTLATNATLVVSQLQDAITNRLIVGKENFFLTNPNSVVNTIIANEELFSDADRAQIASLLTDATFDISTGSKPLIQAAISAINSAPVWLTLCANYKAQITSIFGNGTSTSQPLAATNSTRLLFASKITKLGSLPDSTLATPGLLPAIQDLATSFTPVMSVLTANEQAAVTKLQTLTQTANILKNLQDPDGILNLAAQLINVSQQVTAIQTLIAGRYASSINTAGAPVVPTFTTAQCTKIMALLETIINNRDELTDDDKKTVNVVLQTCRVIAELRTLKTATTNLTIDALAALLTTAVSDGSQLKKLETRAAGIALKASTDQSRQLFFQYLNAFITAQPAKSPALLNELNTTVLTTLQAIPLSSDESTIVAAAVTAMNNTNTANKSFVAQLKNAQDTIAALEDYIAFLQKAMLAKGITTIFTDGDFDTLITQIAYIVDSRELLKSTDSLVNLIRTAQLQPEMAKHKEDLASLLAEATTAHPFADRIKYITTDFDGVIKRKQANPTNTNVDQGYLRLIQKLAIINTAPGIKTEEMFNDLDVNVLRQMIAISTDSALVAQLQKIRTDLLAGKQEVIQQQTKFSYHFAAAQEQKTSTSVYISLLKNIIENERKGLITFSGTDATTYITALSELVANRDNLSGADLATLGTAINYAIYSNTYKSQSAMVKTLSDLYTQVNTPLSFSDRITKYTAGIAQVIGLLPTDPLRITYFTTLNTLFDAPGERGSQAITQLQNIILTPLLASPLTDSEKATVQALQTFVVNAQQNNKTAAYQLQQISTLPSLSDVVSGLSDILKRKGISVIFTTDDFTTLVEQIAYLVDNRELIQVNAINKDSNAINNLTSLIRAALLAPELANAKDALNTLLTNATTQHTFNERITYAATEITSLIKLQSSNKDMDLNYRYNRLITKLNIILDAPGLKTEELFNTLETTILTPLIQLATADQQQTQLQAIRTTILNNKSSILAQQNTFAYHFAAAQEQKDNLSVYIGMLKDIIANERQNVVTFDATKNDGQTYINALTALLATRDLLSPNDLTMLQDAINFAVFSKTFSSNPSQVTALQQLLTLTTTPILFADRIANYSKNTMAIITKPVTDKDRITFFVGLRNLLSAPGLKTPAAIATLQNSIITPLTSSPLSTSETATLNDVKSFLLDAQKQVQSASYQIQQLQALDWNSYIVGLQDLLKQKGLNLQFTSADFEIFMAHLRYIVNNRELLQVGATMSLLVTSADSLLRAAQLVPELAKSKDEIAQLIIELASPHTFADRIAYIKTEVLTISNLIKGNNQISLDYWYDRIISKLSTITTAPGTKNEDLFNDIEISIINPMLAIINDAPRDQSLQDIRVKLTQNKAAILKAQTTFQYHFDAAQEQKNNLSAYASLLKDIMSNQRKGIITFSDTTNDGQTFIDALTDILNKRDLLSANDLSLITDTINFAVFSSIYSANQSQITTLQKLLTLANTPILLGDRVTNYSKNTTAILPLASSDPVRISFFSGLRSLLNAPGTKTAAIITTLQNSILTPLAASPLSADETTVVNNLKAFLINAQTQVQSANYQMQQLQGSDWATYIAGLQALLTQKGISLQFTSADFDLFMTHLRYIVNNRELLQVGNTVSLLVTSADSLLRAAQLVPELSKSKDEIAQLIIELASPHTFADRIMYIKTEVLMVSQLLQANNQVSLDYWYDRIISKLSNITNAPGTKTEALFNDIEISIINPMLTVITDPVRDQSLQDIRTKLTQGKAAILKAQTTFQYHFDAAQEQKNNLSTYVSLLKDIMSNERKGIITFNTDSNDGQTFIDTLTNVLNKRDLLSNNDLSLIRDTINFALFSSVYTNNQAQIAALQQLLTYTNTPIPFADRVTNYSKDTNAILPLQSTDQTRINFFTGLRSLLNAPGAKTAAIITTLQNNVITPLASSPLAADETTIVNNLKTFLVNAQTQVQSANYQMQQLQGSDWATYIAGLQSMLTQKGISLDFSTADFDTFMAHLRYIVNNRELLTVTTGVSSLTRSADALLRTAQLVPELAGSKTDIAELIIELAAPHSFSDRIAYITTEIGAITQLLKSSSDFSADYWYDRILSKLSTITKAPGTKTGDLFNAIEISIINPLLKMITDNGRLQTLQGIRTTLGQNKAAILQAQTTFQYHFDAAQEQIGNTSTYLSLLQDIIANERKGTITFDTTKSPSDAVTFINALTAVTQLRDGFTDNDNKVLTTALNYALYSNSFKTNATLTTQIQQLITTISTPIPFADRVTLYSSKIASMLSLPASDDKRIAFFKNLQSLMDAPGLKTTASITQLNTAIIAPLAATPLNEDEQAVVKNLQNFLTTAQSDVKSARYQISILQAQEDLPAYIAGLQDLLTRKGTYFTFSQPDYQAFVNELKYIVNTRELLTGAGLTAAENLVASTQLSADFSTFNDDLKLLNQQIKLPFYFNDRVTWMTTEVQTLASRNVTETDAMLIRFITKLGYLLQAPQQNTTEQQFNVLETKVITPLSALALSDEQKKTIETIRGKISAGKAQIMLLQTTFKYYYDLAQTQQDNLDSYISILRDAMIKQRDGSVTLAANDGALLLTAITTLVTNRDDLTTDQIGALKTLINYSVYSPTYKGTPDAAMLNNLYQQVNQPVPLATRLQKYSAKIADILFLQSDDAKRVQFFNQLNSLPNSTETLTPPLADILNTQIITKLGDSPLSFTEQAVIKSLQSYTAATARAAQSVSFLLQVADDANTDLYAYAQAVLGIMQQKGNQLTFTAADDTKTIGALTYVVASRELLGADQIKSLLQLLNQVIWLGTFDAQKATLQSMIADLQTPHLFSDCVSYLSQELRSMMVNKTVATSARMSRYIAKLGIILKATGPSVGSDFDLLQNTVTQLQTLALPDAQKATVASIMAQIVANRDSILAAQKTFIYNFNQAQLLQDNLTNYITALLSIITGIRQNTIAMQPADYTTFINALLIVSDQQDALSTSDIETLKTVVNYAYYSPGFAASSQYQSQLLGINTALNTPVSFTTRVAQYADALSKIVLLDPSAVARQRFFSKIQTVPNLSGSNIISDVENFAAKILTPLQATPLNASEKAIVATLASFVENIRQQASTLGYNIKLIADAITANSTTNAANPVDIMINGLNDIIIKRNAGAIKFSGNDYQQIVGLATDLVNNRELFDDAKTSRVQSMIRAIQFGSGFESFKATLDTLYTQASTPLMFTERLTKYRNEMPEMNSTAITDPSKTQFVAMVSSIMAAPGDRSVDLITKLETDVLNPIKFGNFTDKQKQLIDPVLMATAAEKTRLTGFAYRLSIARNALTPSDYYRALTQIITDLTNGTLTLASTDFTTMVAELDKLVTLRPLTPDTKSELFGLVAMVKTAPTFATRTDLANRLTQLNSIMSMPVDIPARVAYFTGNTMAMLSLPNDNGLRSQFFSRLSSFGTEITTIPAATIAQTEIQASLNQLISAVTQYQLSSTATAAEKTIFSSLIRQLQDTTATGTPTPTTSAPTVPAGTTPPATTQQPVVLPTVTSPQVSRFYKAAPNSRYAQ